MNNNVFSTRKPYISIIVPIYKVKTEFLEICINSIINQTYNNLDYFLL